MHIPVLLKETIKILDPKPGEIFIDATFGSGGHSLEILKRILPGGRLLAMDWDEEAIKKGKGGPRFQKPEIIFVNENYANISKVVEKIKFPKADGLLIDLGFSSNQLESGRGFSFLKNEPLDMRFSKTNDLTAVQVINSFNERELSDIFFKYGQERYSRKIAKEIVSERRKKRILTTFKLVEIIKESVPKSYERGRINPATRVFQALRILINSELENLKYILGNMEEVLNSGARVAIISFHSLEDKIIKEKFRQMAKQNKVNILTKKPITPRQEEIKNNPKSRSAKLRAIITTDYTNVNTNNADNYS